MPDEKNLTTDSDDEERFLQLMRTPSYDQYEHNCLQEENSEVEVRLETRDSIEPEQSESVSMQENGRRHRRSSIMSYKEPSVRSKLRAGDQNTFSSGYEVGIKVLSMAEKERERAKRRNRQSLS